MTSRPWRFPLFVSGLILLSQAFPLPSPVRDAATLEWAPGFKMHYPMAHLLFTPYCGLADMLTVLSYRQAVVTLAWTLLALFFLGGLARGLKWFIVIIIYIAWGALVPRPMGKLFAQDRDLLLIDFHSHTQFSHDGRPSFTPEANMRWHADQGYNASFITDHNRTEAPLWAKEDSRREWKNTGYRSFEGEEVSLWKTHLVILGNHSLIDNRPYDSDPQKIPFFFLEMKKKKIPVVASLPEYWLYHWDEPKLGTFRDFVAWGASGFEIINSAPKAMDFPLRKRIEIVDLCRNENLFVTGISDNHGYGYATAVWNAMRIPGWQSKGPDALEIGVLDALKRDGFRSVQVLERIRFIPQSAWQLALTPFPALYLYWRSLQPLQAVSWIVWLWAIYFCYPSTIRYQQRSGPER